MVPGQHTWMSQGGVMVSVGAEVVLEVVEMMNDSPSLNSGFGVRCDFTTSE